MVDSSAVKLPQRSFAPADMYLNGVRVPDDPLVITPAIRAAILGGAFETREKLDRLLLHRPGEAPQPQPLPEIPLKDRKGALATFARWIATDRVPEGASTGRDNLMSLALKLAAIRSAAQGGARVRIKDMLEENAA